MPVWDDINRDDDHASPLDELSPPSPATATLDRARAHDEVRAAVQKDAADIIARARRDIRRIVGDARRELLELSAQVQAADVELPDAALAAGLIEVEERLLVPVAGDWLAEPPAIAAVAAPEPEAPAYRDVVPEDIEPVAGLNIHGAPLTSPGPARTFVALFALAGFLVVGGTVWWLRRPPSAEAGVATTVSPAPATSSTPPVPVAAPSSAGGTTARSEPLAVPRTQGLSVVIEAQRETWIRTTIDGESDAGRTFAPGERRQVNAVNEVSIRAGDAGGVLISVDGAPASPFGPAGTSLTRRFTRTAGTAPRPAAATPEPSVTSPVAAAPTAPQPTSAVPPPSVPTAATAPARGNVVQPAPVTPAPPSTQLPSPGRGPTSGRIDISASGRQWLDAYHRQDRISMESLSSTSLVINDERRPDQRFPFGLEVTRAFEDEQLQLAGDSAMFTARMTERAATGARVSMVSQTWVRRLGAWHLQEARIAPEVQTPPPSR